MPVFFVQFVAKKRKNKETIGNNGENHSQTLQKQTFEVKIYV